MDKIASETPRNSRYHKVHQPYAKESRRKDRIQVKNGPERPLSCHSELVVSYVARLNWGARTSKVGAPERQQAQCRD